MAKKHEGDQRGYSAREWHLAVNRLIALSELAAATAELCVAAASKLGDPGSVRESYEMKKDTERTFHVVLRNARSLFVISQDPNGVRHLSEEDKSEKKERLERVVHLAGEAIKAVNHEFADKELDY